MNTELCTENRKENEGKLFVELLAHTPDPETLVATAAKLCYSTLTVEELIEKTKSEDNVEFINKLINMGHTSPIEHVSFTFAISGVSRSLTHQLVRHRIASFSQKSQRYIGEDNFKFLIPPYMRLTKEIEDRFLQAMESEQEDYNEIAEMICDELISDLDKYAIKDKKAAKKIAYENARAVLPNACESSIIVTMNARSLFNFFKHRCCNRAQTEIRVLANKMLCLVMQVAPNIFRHAGAECTVTGVCPEGASSCGHPIGRNSC